MRWKKRQSESAIDNDVGSCCTLGRRMGKVKLERMMIQIGSFITKLSFMKWNLIKICVYWEIFLFSFSFFYIVCKSYKWQKKNETMWWLLLDIHWFHQQYNVENSLEAKSYGWTIMMMMVKRNSNVKAQMIYHYMMAIWMNLFFRFFCFHWYCVFFLGPVNFVVNQMMMLFNMN